MAVVKRAISRGYPEGSSSFACQLLGWAYTLTLSEAVTAPTATTTGGGMLPYIRKAAQGPFPQRPSALPPPPLETLARKRG